MPRETTGHQRVNGADLFYEVSGDLVTLCANCHRLKSFTEQKQKRPR